MLSLTCLRKGEHEHECVCVCNWTPLLNWCSSLYLDPRLTTASALSSSNPAHHLLTHCVTYIQLCSQRETIRHATVKLHILKIILVKITMENSQRHICDESEHERFELRGEAMMNFPSC